MKKKELISIVPSRIIGRFCLAAALLLAVQRPAWSQLELLGVDLEVNKFVSVDIAGGGSPAVEEHGEVIADVESMTYDPVSDSIYATVETSGRTSVLVRISPDDIDLDPVQITTIGTINRFGAGSQVNSADIEALAFHPVNGELFAIDNDKDRLVRIDKNTALFVYVGPPDEDLSGVESMAFTLSDPSRLFAINNVGSKFGPFEDRPILLEIDLVTGEANPACGTYEASALEKRFNNIEALEFGPGSGGLAGGDLFAFSDPHDNLAEETFLTIDLGTCDGTVFSTMTGNDREIEGFTFLLPVDLIPVELANLSIKAQNGRVTLSWTTFSETENLGFHIYRSEVSNLGFERLNQEVIPGNGTTNDTHEYSYIDQAVETGNTYYYRLADLDFNGRLTFHGRMQVRVDDAGPQSFGLAHAYPNPLRLSQNNAQAAVTYQLEGAGHVNLSVYNILGQKVATLVDRMQDAGSYTQFWNGRNDFGLALVSGVYFYRLEANGQTVSKKLLLTR